MSLTLPKGGHGKLAEWMDQPLTPAKEKELNEWLAQDPDHQLKWERWTEFAMTAKLLQIVPSDAASQWTILRDDLGFQRSTKSKRRKKSFGGGRSMLKSPILVAFIAMALFSGFLAILYMIRISAGPGLV